MITWVRARPSRLQPGFASTAFEAWLVGGSVRDLLLGREPKDYDISTDARPDQLLEHLSASPIGGRAIRRGAGGRRRSSHIPQRSFLSGWPASIRGHLRDRSRSRMSCAAISPSTHCCWIRFLDFLGFLEFVGFSRYRLTSAALPICAPTLSAPSAIPSSASRKTTCACCAPSGSPRDSVSRSSQAR